MGSLSSSQRRYSTAKKPSTITSSVLPTCSCQRGLASTVLLPAYSHESNLVFEWKSKSLEYGLFFGDTSTSRRSLPEPVLTVCCTSPYAESIPTIYLTNLLMASKVRIPRTSWKTMLRKPSRIPFLVSPVTPRQFLSHPLLASPTRICYLHRIIRPS